MSRRRQFISGEAGDGSPAGSTCLRSHRSHTVSALQEQFVTEARELISQATDDLIVLERDGASPERIDRVFRAFHTLKGSAGVVELPAMSIMLHAAEDLLASRAAGNARQQSRHHRCGAGMSRSGIALGRRLRGCRSVARAGRRGWPGLAERLRSFLPAAGRPAAGARRREIRGGCRSRVTGMGRAPDRDRARCDRRHECRNVRQPCRRFPTSRSRAASTTATIPCN